MVLTSTFLPSGPSLTISSGSGQTATPGLPSSEEHITNTAERPAWSLHVGHKLPRTQPERFFAMDCSLRRLSSTVSGDMSADCQL